MKQVTFFIALLIATTSSYSQDCTTAVNDPCIVFGGAFETHRFAEAWALECGSEQDKDGVAVVDIFSDQVHQDLYGKVAGDSVVAASPLPQFLACHHGVSVAGTIGAMPNNGNYVAGVGYNTKVGLYNVGTGACSSIGNVGDGVKRAIADGFKIINVSGTGIGLSPLEVTNFTNDGVVFVLAGANGHHASFIDIPGVIVCGRVMWNPTLNGWTYWDYSASGASDNTPDRGLDIFGYPVINRLTGLTGCEPASGGTSIVTPMVAGVVALMRSANPDLTPADVECIIRMTGRSQVIDGPTHPVPDDANPVLLDAEAAVQMAIDYNPDAFMGENLRLSGTQTFSNITVSGSLIIESGADITLDGTVNMGYNSNIIVNKGARLHIDGATVGPMQCVSSWRGFRVVGNSFRPQPDENAVLAPDDSGVLIINNGAQINNARKAVSMNNTHIVWDQTSKYYGGLVIAENAFFNFNERSFEFMRYANFQDNSRIINCTFKQNTKNVMTLWRNHGLSIENNEFKDYQKSAIYSLNAGYDVVNNNVFNGVNNSANEHYGILIQNTTMTTEHVPFIEKNIFNANGYGIFFEGITPTISDLTGLRIKSNSFQNLKYGIQIQGTNAYDITLNNIFADNSGINCFNSGSSENKIDHNRMANGVRGIGVIRDNSGMRFYENCFENLGITFQDQTFGGGVELFEDDSIDPTVFMIQSNDADNAADNCFDNVADNIFTAISTGLPADHFAYLVEPNFPITDCRVPDVKHFIEVVDAISDNEEPCVNIPIFLSPSGTATSSKCTIPTGEADLKNSIALLEQDIIDLLPLDSTDIEDRKDIYDLLTCLKRLKMELIRNFVGNDKEGSVENRFGQEEDPYVRTYAYSHLVNTSHYTEAAGYLNGVQDNDEDWQDFRQAQLINMRRLQEIDSFTATQSEIDFLYGAGKQHTFYATWIRSIYTAVSGDVIVFEVPREASIPKRENHRKALDRAAISIYPNPATDDITISGLPADLPYVIKIYDITGTEVAEQNNVENGQAIKITDLMNGVYVLRVFDNDRQIIHTTKIIKMQ